MDPEAEGGACGGLLTMLGVASARCLGNGPTTGGAGPFKTCSIPTCGVSKAPKDGVVEVTDEAVPERFARAASFPCSSFEEDTDLREFELLLRFIVPGTTRSDDTPRPLRKDVTLRMLFDLGRK